MKLSIGAQTALHHFLIAGVAAAVPVAVLVVDPTPLGVLLGGLLGAGASALLYAKVPSAQQLADRQDVQDLEARNRKLQREVDYLKGPQHAINQGAMLNRMRRAGPIHGSRDAGPL